MLEPDTFDRIPKDTAWSIERSFFPSLIERGETFVAYVYDGYWIDIGTPAKYLQVHRDIMDGRYSGAAVRRRQSQARGSRPDARVEEGVELHGPCFIDEGAVVKAGAQILPYSVIGRQTHVDEAARHRRRRSSGRTAGSAAKPSSAASILGRNCHIGRNAVVDTPGACSATRPSSPTTAGYDRHQPVASSRRTTSAASIRPRSTRTRRG